MLGLLLIDRPAQKIDANRLAEDGALRAYVSYELASHGVVECGVPSISGDCCVSR